MPFLTHENILDYLPKTSDIKYVKLVLDMVENYLSGLGFDFDLIVNSELKLYPKYDFQNEFRYLFFTDPTTVTIKSEEDLTYSKALTIRKDYLLENHHKITTANYLLSLKDEVVQYPYYLELNTSTGFSAEVPSDLKFAIIEFVKQALNIQKSVQSIFDGEGQEVKSTSIEGVDIELIGTNQSPTKDKIQELLAGDSGIMQIIKNYLPRK
jgi:hypothetical protein